MTKDIKDIEYVKQHMRESARNTSRLTRWADRPVCKGYNKRNGNKCHSKVLWNRLTNSPANGYCKYCCVHYELIPEPHFENGAYKDEYLCYLNMLSFMTIKMLRRFNNLDQDQMKFLKKNIARFLSFKQDPEDFTEDKTK